MTSGNNMNTFRFTKHLLEESNAVSEEDNMAPKMSGAPQSQVLAPSINKPQINKNIQITPKTIG
jgi:hypothetical protein